MESPIAKNFVKLSDENRTRLCAKNNTVQYLLKHKRPYKDYSKCWNFKRKTMVLELLDKQIEFAYATTDAGAIFADFIGTY